MTKQAKTAVTHKEFWLCCLKVLSQSCSTHGVVVRGSVLGWHEEPVFATGKAMATGVTHSQRQDLSICTWRVRLSQQEPNPHHSVRIPGAAPGLGQRGEVYSHGASDVDGVFSLQHAGLWLLHCGSELSFRQVLSWSQLTPGWRWLVGR